MDKGEVDLIEPQPAQILRALCLLAEPKVPVTEPEQRSLVPLCQHARAAIGGEGCVRGLAEPTWPESIGLWCTMH